MPRAVEVKKAPLASQKGTPVIVTNKTQQKQGKQAPGVRSQNHAKKDTKNKTPSSKAPKKAQTTSKTKSSKPKAPPPTSPSLLEESVLKLVKGGTPFVTIPSPNIEVTSPNTTVDCTTPQQDKQEVTPVPLCVLQPQCRGTPQWTEDDERWWLQEKRRTEARLHIANTLQTAKRRLLESYRNTAAASSHFHAGTATPTTASLTYLKHLVSAHEATIGNEQQSQNFTVQQQEAKKLLLSLSHEWLMFHHIPFTRAPRDGPLPLLHQPLKVALATKGKMMPSSTGMSDKDGVDERALHRMRLAPPSLKIVGGS